MKNGKIGVGIIGVSPERSWAAVAHIPALRALPDYEITALSTTRQETADHAAAHFGVPNAFASAEALASCPDVDLVVVAVKVPHHFELVKAAIQAGKNIYCEWPLGNGLAEAVEMAALARSHKVHAAAGLQARAAPAVNYVRDLVAQGYVGKVLSTTLIGSGLSWGATVDAANAYTADRENGATLLTIPLGHTMDAVCYTLGEVAEINAAVTCRRTTTSIGETGKVIPMTAEDQVIAGGLLENGVAFSVHYRGGLPRGTGLLWEINGTDGDLQLSAFAGHGQIFEMSVQGATRDEPALQPLEVPGTYYRVPRFAGPAYNLAQAYARLASDLRHGTHECACFDDAVVRHRMVAAIEASAVSGTRRSPADFA